MTGVMGALVGYAGGHVGYDRVSMSEGLNCEDDLFHFFLVNLTYFGFLDLLELTDKDYFNKPTFVRFLVKKTELC